VDAEGAVKVLSEPFVELLAQPTGPMTHGSAIALAVIAVVICGWMVAIIFNLWGYREKYLARMERLYRRPTRPYSKNFLIAICSTILAFTVVMLVAIVVQVVGHSPADPGAASSPAGDDTAQDYPLLTALAPVGLAAAVLGVALIRNFRSIRTRLVDGLPQSTRFAANFAVVGFAYSLISCCGGTAVLAVINLFS
jgi:hypothetical protein